jgi:hypothetical protein
LLSSIDCRGNTRASPSRSFWAEYWSCVTNCVSVALI